MIFACDLMAKRCFDESQDVFDLLDQFSETATRIRMSVDVGKAMRHIHALIAEEAKEYDEKTKALAQGMTIGTNTGFKALNNNTGGWQNSDLVIIAARPSMGKTAFMLNTARAASSSGAVGIFSLEMSALQLVKRLLQTESGIDAKDYKNARLQNGEILELMKAREQMSALGIHIDDTPALPIMELRDKARRLRQHHEVKLILVDYLQLVNGRTDRNMNREGEIANISRNLKSMAKELNVPVVALSQLSRKVEDRPDKRPLLSDLRESGSIEQDADMVLFIHRPEYYGFETDEGGNSTAGVAELIIAKHRNGDTGVINLSWHPHLTKFTDPDEHYSPYAGLQQVNGYHPDRTIQPRKETEEDPY